MLERALVETCERDEGGRRAGERRVGEGEEMG
jgi:hypothetical protein